MRYVCMNCGKAVELENARFCPFCGKAYTSVQAENARSNEVQAKYWQMTRRTIAEALSLAVHEQPNLERKRLTESSSEAQAKQFLTQNLEAVEQTLTAQEKEKADLPADRVNELGRKLAQILGGEATDDKPKEATVLLDEKQQTEAMRLLDSLKKTKGILNRLMDENGVYVLTGIEGEKATKQTLTEQRDAIETLAKKDYDPLFGEPYEPFVAAYMQALESLSKLFKPV